MQIIGGYEQGIRSAYRGKTRDQTGINAYSEEYLDGEFHIIFQLK